MAFSVVVGLGSGTGRHDYNLKLNALGSLMWLQCKPCNPKQPQCAPMFEPKASSTFQQVAGTSQICHLPYPMEPAGSSAPYTYPASMTYRCTASWPWTTSLWGQSP